jgi:hypothetical protein
VALSTSKICPSSGRRVHPSGPRCAETPYSRAQCSRGSHRAVRSRQFSAGTAHRRDRQASGGSSGRGCLRRIRTRALHPAYRAVRGSVLATSRRVCPVTRMSRVLVEPNSPGNQVTMDAVTPSVLVNRPNFRGVDSLRTRFRRLGHARHLYDDRKCESTSFTSRPAPRCFDGYTSEEPTAHEIGHDLGGLDWHGRLSAPA